MVHGPKWDNRPPSIQDRRLGAEHVEGVHQAVDTQRLGAQPSQLDDLLGGEILPELGEGVGGDGVVIGGEQIEKTQRQQFLPGIRPWSGSARKATSCSLTVSSLRETEQGWQALNCALRRRRSSCRRGPREPARK
jgi:hypothetical protein